MPQAFLRKGSGSSDERFGVNVLLQNSQPCDGVYSLFMCPVFSGVHEDSDRDASDAAMRKLDVVKAA